MKNLKLLITSIFITCLVFNIGFSQSNDDSYTIKKISVKYQDNENFKILDVMRFSHGYIVFLKEQIEGKKKGKIYINKFSLNYQLISSVDVSQKFIKEKFYFVKTMEMGERVMLFSSQYTRKTKSTILYAQELDLATLELGPSEVVKELQGKIAFNIDSMDDEEMFKVSVAYRGFFGSTGATFTWFIIDDKLNELWDLSAYSDVFKEGWMTLQIDFVFDKDGRAYLLYTSAPTPESRLILDPSDYEPQALELLILEIDGEVTRIPLEVFEDKYFDILKLVQSKTDEVYVVGYYEEENNVGTAGEFIIELDRQSKTIKSHKWLPFSKDLMDDLAEDKEKFYNLENDKLYIYNLYFRDVVLHDDGSFTIIGEIYKVSSNYNASTSSYVNVYYYGDYILSRYDKEEMANYRVDQNRNIKHASYFFNARNKLVFLNLGTMLDLQDSNPDDLTKKTKKDLEKREVVFETQVDKYGRIEKNVIYNISQSKYQNSIKFRWLDTNCYLNEYEGGVELLWHYMNDREAAELMKITY